MANPIYGFNRGVLALMAIPGRDSLDLISIDFLPHCRTHFFRPALLSPEQFNAP